MTNSGRERLVNVKEKAVWGTKQAQVVAFMALYVGCAAASELGCSSNTMQEPITPSPSGAANGDGGRSSSSDGQQQECSANARGGSVVLDSVFNTRQVAGLGTSDGKCIREKVLIRSGHLAALSTTGCGQVNVMGIRSVIDLRSSAETAAEPDASCILTATRYLHADLPKILPPTETSYKDTLDAAESKLDDIFAHLAVEGGLPVLVHCIIGRDRAGIVSSVLLRALGVPREQVVSDFVTNQDPSVSVQPSWMNAVMDRIDQAGGIDSYLQQHGVTAAQTAQLKSMALQ